MQIEGSPPIEIAGEGLTYAQILELIPETIIWQTSDIIRAFCDKSPAQKELWDQNALGQLVNEIIEYLADYNSSISGIEEVADQMRMQFAKYATGQEDAESQADAVQIETIQLGMKLRESLLKLGAYHYQGVLLYRFGGWNDYDVILQRLAQEEVSFLDVGAHYVTNKNQHVP